MILPEMSRVALLRALQDADGGVALWNRSLESAVNERTRELARLDRNVAEKKAHLELAEAHLECMKKICEPHGVTLERGR